MPSPSPSPSTIKVLIGSGNLGNAEPNERSLNAWIPHDGLCRPVLEDPKYPLVVPNTDGQQQHVYNHDQERFDLIVLGLQESTFEPRSNVNVNVNDVNGNDVTANVNDVTSNAEETTTTELAKEERQTTKRQRQRQKSQSRTLVHKGVASFKSLAASRDHTKAQTAAEIIPLGTHVLHKMLEKRLPSYARLLSFQRGEMRLLIYAVRKNTMNPTTTTATTTKFEIQSVRAQNTGIAGIAANKGGIVAQVLVKRAGGTMMTNTTTTTTTTLSFVSCHLEAHEGILKYATRCSTLADILQGTKKPAVPPIYPDVSLSSHACFVLGDLNFRTRYNNHVHLKDQMESVLQLIQQQNWKALNYQTDELYMALEKQHCLYGFQTPICNFPPTFKVQRQRGYQYLQNRTPSYTDRILYKTADLLQHTVTPLLYEPIDSFETSDHKPIRGAFLVQLNEPLMLPKRRHYRFSVLPWLIAKNLSVGYYSSKKQMQQSTNGQHQHQRHHNKRLQLFVSDIQCDIFPNANPSSPSTTQNLDSYICLVSSPEELLAGTPSLWYRTVNKLQKRLLSRPSDKANRWPCTSVYQNSRNPDWKDQELQCTFQTHRLDGTPINLTGAMLHIFLFQCNGRQPDHVIGSFAINLEHLFRTCIKAGRSIKNDDGGGINDNDDNNPWRPAMPTSTTPSANGNANNISIKNDGGGSSSSSNDNDPNNNPRRPAMPGTTSSTNGNVNNTSFRHKKLEQNVMLSRDIEGPMLRNGQQTAILRCSMDAWWVDENLVEAGNSMLDESRSERLSYSKGIIRALQETKNSSM